MPPIWIDPKEVSVPENLKSTVDAHPLVAEMLVRRGFADPVRAQAFLDPAHYTPTPAAALPDLKKATERLEQAIRNNELILVWGDFDVDGQTSTTLLVEALQALGADLIYHIPVRATEGHGIKVDVLEQIVSANPAIRVLLTCDTGVSENEAVRFANTNGLDVVITDHHDIPEKLPSAHAIVDPKLLPDDHPLATLPGVGVAYKVIEHLFSNFRKKEECNNFLDLVALGIVADVAEQRDDARYLLQQGLAVLRDTQRLGLQMLMEVAQINPDQLDETTIGFGIGPRLNALGRLSDANPIVELLTTKDPVRARVLATQLEGLNERRKLLTEQITQAALTLVERDPTLLNPAALVLAYEDWHTGVIGIVASRLVERFGKPTILLSIGEDGLARGSARSIEGVHITEAIATQRARLTGFGGHPGAAGLALPAEEIGEFRRGLGNAVRKQLGDQLPELNLQIDAYIPLSEISLELVDDLNLLAPFGAGNPALTLASRDLKLVSQTPIGRSKTHLRLVVSDQEDQHLSVLWWNGVGNPMPEAEFLFDLAYTIQSGTFRGERQLQVQWVDFRSTAAITSEPEEKISTIDYIDLRQKAYPLAQLKSLQSEIEIQVWAEGDDRKEIQGVNRLELAPTKNLAIWTIPPGPREWQAALERTNPEKIYLFAITPKTDEPQTFLARLAGLVKYALRVKSGEIEIVRIAATTAQQENTVRMGMLWLEAKGHLQIKKRADTTYWIAPGIGEPNKEAAEIFNDLKSMLKETAAYRAYFRKRTDFFNMGR